MNLRTFFAYDPTDTDEIRLEKLSIFLVSGACTLAGLVWTAMYLLIFGWRLTAFLPFAFVIIVGSSLVIAHLTKKHVIAIYTQIICITYITAFIQWSIGGIFDSGMVLVWAFLGPICALMFFSVRQSIFWFSLYLLNLLISAIFNDDFAAHGQVVAANTRLFFFTMNLGVASIVVFFFASYYVNRAIKEREKTNKLLQSNLQQAMALQLNEKLATLGKLSAGITHELNNPASAAQRGAAHLQDTITKLEQTSLQVGQLNLADPQMDVLKSQSQLIRDRAQELPALDTLTRSDRENAIETWLDDRGIDSAWELAPMLVNIGYSSDELMHLAQRFTNEQFPAVATFLGYRSTTYHVLDEVSHGLGRIIEIVNALKSYSYLDQAPIQSVDVRGGLNDTLIMLGSKLKLGIEVRKEYAEDIPRIEAFGSELNQVWTNIMDNAITAMDGHGEIILKTSRHESWVVVEIQDSGRGIPPDIQEKIFDPFFTTKAPGEGTGLGLSISHSIIVQKHRGTITVSSKPGETRFEVRLPIHSREFQLG